LTTSASCSAGWAGSATPENRDVIEHNRDVIKTSRSGFKTSAPKADPVAETSFAAGTPSHRPRSTTS